MHIDGARQEMQSAGVDPFPRRRHLIRRADPDDSTGIDGDRLRDDTFRADDLPSSDDKIHFVHGRAHGTNSAMSCATSNKSALRFLKLLDIDRTSRNSASTSNVVTAPLATTTRPSIITVSTLAPVSANTIWF